MGANFLGASCWRQFVRKPVMLTFLIIQMFKQSKQWCDYWNVWIIIMNEISKSRHIISEHGWIYSNSVLSIERLSLRLIKQLFCEINMLITVYSFNGTDSVNPKIDYFYEMFITVDLAWFLFYWLDNYEFKKPNWKLNPWNL